MEGTEAAPICSRVCVLIPMGRGSLSAAFQEQLSRSRALNLGVGAVYHLPELRSVAVEKQKPVRLLAVIGPLFIPLWGCSRSFLTHWGCCV